MRCMMFLLSYCFWFLKGMAGWGRAPLGPIGASMGAKKNRLVNKMGLANGGWVTGWVTRIKNLLLTQPIAIPKNRVFCD